MDLEKAEEPEVKLPTSAGSLKNQENSRKTSISALLTMSKPLTVCITKKLENSSRDGNTRPPYLLLRYLYAVKRQQLEPEMEQTGSKLGKEYIKAVYFYPACLTYMQKYKHSKCQTG